MSINEFEKKGRENLKKVFPQIAWKFTTTQMAVFDAYAEFDNKKITAEIKCRQYNIEQFSNCFLEIKKYAELTNTVNYNEEIIYVVHYKNGYTATWNITPETNKKYELVNVLMNKQTATNSILKKIKPCIILPLEKADIRKTETGEKVNLKDIK